MYTIRDYQEKDYECLIRFIYIAAGVCENDVSRQKLLTGARLDLGRDTIRFLENETGRVIGCYRHCPWPLDAQDTQCAHLFEIAILPDFQHQGFGTLLIGDAIEKLKQDGFGLLYSASDETNIASIKFHEKCGFERFRSLNGKIIWSMPIK